MGYEVRKGKSKSQRLLVGNLKKRDVLENRGVMGNTEMDHKGIALY